MTQGGPQGAPQGQALAGGWHPPSPSCHPAFPGPEPTAEG
jgi:hypothetical protein